MNEPEAELEEQFTTWLAACDDALAAGALPPGTPPPNDVRARDALACARLLREVLGSSPFLSTPVDPEGSGLPWKMLGRFRLRRELGRGGCGVVFLAVDTQLGREVALKVPHVSAALTPQLRERFQREARAASYLDHPNIVPVHEVGEVGPVQYIVSAYCAGSTLAAWIKARQEAIPFPDAAKLVATLADAVAHAHSRGVIHRDLKPGNVLLQPDTDTSKQGGKKTTRQVEPSFSGGAKERTDTKSLPPVSSGEPVWDAGPSNQCTRSRNPQTSEEISVADCLPPSLSECTPKITDFGLAKLLESPGEAPTQTGLILGTVNYMAPEQAEGKTQAIGPAADIYALGAVLYELLTGQPPFRGDSDLHTIQQMLAEDPVPPSRLRHRMPRDLQTICLKCLHKDPLRRYASAAALAEDLRRFLENRPILARRPSRWEIAWRWCRRNPGISSLAAAMVLLLVAVTIGSVITADRFRLQRDQVAHAEREKTKELVRSLIAQVRARRQSGQPGRRLDSLDILAKAVQLRADLGEPEDLPSIKELRDEMIGCLVLADMRPIHRWPGFPPGSWRIAFDGDFKRYAVADRKGKVRVATVDGNAELATFFDPAKTDPRFLRLSPDGRYAALIRWRDGQVRVWDLERQERISLAMDPVDDNSTLAFDPASRRLAVGHPDGTVSLHDLEPPRLIRRLSHPGQTPVTWVSFDPAGRRLAVGHAGQKIVEIIDIQSNQIEQRLSNPAKTGDMCWSDDGKRLAVVSAPSTIVVWDTITWRILNALPGHAGFEGVRVAFQPGSELLASLAWDDQLRLWHIPSGREVFRMTSSVNGEGFQFSRDGQRWSVKEEGSDVSVWQVAASREYRTLKRVEGWSPENHARGGAISPDSRLLALASGHGVHFWDLATGRDVAMLPAGPVRDVAFSPQQDALYVYGTLGLIRWPMTRSVEVPGQIRLGPPEHISSGYGENLALSADGRLLAAAINKQGAKVFQLDDPQAKVDLLPHGNTLTIALSPNGRWLASATKHGQWVTVWDTGAGRVLQTLCPHEQTEHSVAFSPDNHWLVTGAIGEYRVWRTDTWGEAARVTSECGTVPGPIAFSPNSGMLALETAHARISLIDPATGKEFARLEDPDGHRPHWMAFTPDGRRLVTANIHDGVAHVWELDLLGEQLVRAGLDKGLPPMLNPSESRTHSAAWDFQFTLDADTQTLRADAAFDLRDFGGAEKDYREVLREHPHHRRACNGLSWLYSLGPPELRKPCEALALALEAVHQDKSNATLNTLGVAYYRLGRWHEAIDALNQAAKVNGSRPTPWDAFFLAMCHHRLGRFAEARRYYDQAVSLRASYPIEQLHEPAELAEIQAEARAILGQTQGP